MPVFIATFCVYENDMPCTFEINTNGQVKQTFKILLFKHQDMISTLPQCLKSPNEAGW